MSYDYSLLRSMTGLRHCSSKCEPLQSKNPEKYQKPGYNWVYSIWISCNWIRWFVILNDVLINARAQSTHAKNRDNFFLNRFWSIEYFHHSIIFFQWSYSFSTFKLLHFWNRLVVFSINLVLCLFSHNDCST